MTGFLFHAHADGISLILRGETLPSDSFVDVDDVLSTGGDSGLTPSNTNPRDALLCVTDLEGCYASPERGDWYFPDGNMVGSGGSTYQVNRGANDGMGSVRLYRIFSSAPERGRFHCELPNAANVNQILYANISEFITLLV